MKGADFRSASVGPRQEWLLSGSLPLRLKVEPLSCVQRQPQQEAFQTSFCSSQKDTVQFSKGEKRVAFRLTPGLPPCKARGRACGNGD